MLSFLVLCNKAAQTYFQSLKKDLGKAGFDPTLLVVSISWASIAAALVLWSVGKFQMPTDPLFYLFWFLLTLVATSGYILFMGGLIKTKFVAANSFAHLGFVMTTLYAVIILREHLSHVQIAALVLAAFGALLFFEWRTVNREALLHNKGLLLILFALALSPLDLIFYKLAIAHTGSYHQFLSGRLIMDLVYDSLYFLIMVGLVRSMNPIAHAKEFLSYSSALVFMGGTALLNLLDSWLIYNLPASTFTLLGTISIPTGYVVAKMKYHEPITVRYALGGILIIGGVILFVS